MSSPVIAEAQRLWRNAAIPLLGMQHNYDLYAACPLVDRVDAATAIPFTLRGHADVRRLLAWLRSRSFDTALMILGDQLGVLLTQAGIPATSSTGGHLQSDGRL